MSDAERPLDRLAPEGFVDEIDARAGVEIDTVDDALEYAHRQLPSSTSNELQDRCRYCSSIRLKTKSGSISDQPGRIGKRYRCMNCGEHQDDPAPPAAEAPDYDFETMTDERTDAFDWCTDLADTDKRGESSVLRGLSEKECIELAIRLYRPWTDDGPSYRDLAAVFPHGRAWIGERVREWKRGEHRDLVSLAPWPTVDRPTVDTGADTRTAATDGGEP